MKRLADLTGATRTAGQIVRYGTVLLVYSYAKEHNMREYAVQFRSKVRRELPRIGLGQAYKGMLKQLWRKSIVTQSDTFNPMITLLEFCGDAFNWALSCDPFLENKARPAIGRIREDIYLYRIPLYPVLSVIMFLMVHATTGRMGVMGALIPCGLCMEGQILYQVVTSLAMAFAYWGVQKAKKLKWKKTADVCIAVALTYLFRWIFVGLMGKMALLPVSNHIVYLWIPAAISEFMAIFTWMCKHIFRRIVK